MNEKDRRAAPSQPDGRDARGTVALEDLVARWAGIEGQVAGSHRRSTHRDPVIDRLHEENQWLAVGLGSLIVEPLIADLIRLWDQLDREVRRLGPDGPSQGLLLSLRDHVGQILDLSRIEIFSAEPGDPSARDRQRPLAGMAGHEATQHDPAVEVFSADSTERKIGRARCPGRARFHHYGAARDEPGGARP